jgi:hypothetical protein
LSLSLGVADRNIVSPSACADANANDDYANDDYANANANANDDYANADHDHDHNTDNDNTNDNTNLDDEKSYKERFLKFWNSEIPYSEQPNGEKFIDTGLIATFLGCDKSSDEYSDHWMIEDPDAYTQIPTDADFQLFVEAYVMATEKQHERQNCDKDNDNNDNSSGSRFLRPPSVRRYNPNAFVVPIEVRSVPHVGRGVFAKEDIANGTMVMKPANFMEFYSRDTYRDFLAHLVLKRSEFICDHFLWMWGAKKSAADDDYAVCMSADYTSLINSGSCVDCDDKYDDEEYEDEYEDEYEYEDEDEYEDENDEYEDENDEYEGLEDKSASKSAPSLVRKFGINPLPTNDLEEVQVKDDDNDNDDDESKSASKKDVIQPIEVVKLPIDDLGLFNIAQHATIFDPGERTLYGCQTPLLSVYATRDIKAGEGT